MTRTQFIELCQSILRVVSLSSITVILPAVLHGKNHLDSISHLSSSCGAGRPSPAIPVNAGYQILLRIREAVANFRRNIGWRLSCCHLAVARSSCCSMSNLSADSDKSHTPSLSEPAAVRDKSYDQDTYDPQRYDMMLTKLFSSESIDVVAKELVGQLHGVLQTSSALPEAAKVPEALYSYTEAAFKNLLQPHVRQLVAHNAPENVSSPDAFETVPDTGILSEMLLAALRNSNSAPALGPQDSVRDAAASNSMEDQSSCQKHQSLVGSFSSLMVHQLLDMMHQYSVAQNQQGSLQVQASSVTNEPETTSTGRPSSTASWLPVYEDRKDNGCFTTVLLLRLLAKMRDAHTAPEDKMVMSQQLTEKLLAEFTSASGSASVQEYLGNVKIQSIYKTMDTFLVKKFGPEAVLRRAENTQDESFDDILLMKLREELLSIEWRISCCHSAVSTSSCCSMSNLPADNVKSHTPSLSKAATVGDKSYDQDTYDPQRYDMMLRKLPSSESIDVVAKELVGQVHDVLQTSSALPEAAKVPEALYSYAERALKNLLQPLVLPLVAHNAPENVASSDACETVPNTGGLSEMLLAVLKNSNSAAALGPQDSVRDAASNSMDQSSADQKQLDIMHQDSVAQNRQGDLQVQASSVTNEPETTSTGRPSSAASWLPVYEDRKDNGCFTTVLLLRLLAKMRYAHTASEDKMVMSQQLTEKILAEFTSASGGSPSFQEYLGNVNIQSIYKTMDTFLVKKFGPEAVLRRAENAQDESFDDMLLMKLREELLSKHGIEVPAASSALSGSSSLRPASAEAGGQTPRKNKWRLKIPKRRSSKVAPVNSASNIGLQGETAAPRAPSDDSGTAVPAADELKSRKRPWYHIFTACFRRSS
ncbi:uncharacterized protein LOC134463323 [Engraulis encrasicolus]|uniref:uncharacterized protein LOC134463323 n=1 Tax=Engraulis encrasicolus TaxID=184585 RepID=UPI002FD0C875